MHCRFAPTCNGCSKRIVQGFAFGHPLFFVCACVLCFFPSPFLLVSFRSPVCPAPRSVLRYYLFLHFVLHAADASDGGVHGPLNTVHGSYGRVHRSKGLRVITLAYFSCTEVLVVPFPLLVFFLFSVFFSFLFPYPTLHEFQSLWGYHCGMQERARLFMFKKKKKRTLAFC